MGIRGKKMPHINFFGRYFKIIFNFQIVCEILMNYLKEAFAENLTPEGEDAWKKLLEILVSTVDKKLFELQKSNSSCTCNLY